ncbi:hypothetical protein [Lentzea aerocolonigenes]|uniref:hypothetical protein n=1 Tax=Lentzea aerocolonigenes TaxID=68170 RepID=UPI0007510556|nr:hypothetical protein [Lentzea aerocolonigenes]MCP2250220.1 hypothetical protein [Lentzea aerocolonigenes]
MTYQTTWVCPLCRTVTINGTPGNAEICDMCRLRPDWEALPQAVRDEVGAMIDSKSAVPAGYLLAELDGHQRPTMEYMKLAFYGSRARRRTCSCAEVDHGYVSWSCPSCGRPLLGCDETRGEICAPCGSGPSWEALPQAVRDEVGAMADAGDVNNAIHRLRDLDHNRLDSWTYTLMVAYQNSRNSSGSIPRNAS